MLPHFVIILKHDLTSVTDPYVFGPPGSASVPVIYLYGSGSDPVPSINEQKNEEKP